MLLIKLLSPAMAFDLANQVLLLNISSCEEKLVDGSNISHFE